MFALTTIRLVEHPASFGELTLAGFVDRLASADPVPGGGSASAVAASLGAGLVAMVAALSEGRPKYAEHAAMLASTRSTANALAARFLSIADEDAAAYGGYSLAMKLPRDTDAEKAARSASIREAARAAARVPFACVEACLDLAIAAEAMAGRSNVNAASDIEVATLLCEAAAHGAAANVRINLPSVADEAWAADVTARLDALLAQVGTLARSTRAVVASGTQRPAVAAAMTSRP